MIWRRFVQLQAQEAPNGQRVRCSPRHRALRTQPLEVPQQQQPEVPTRWQARTAQLGCVEPAARRFGERVEAIRGQHLIQPLVERMARTLRQVARRNPHRVLRSLPFPSHRHARQTTLRSIQGGTARDFHHGLLGFAVAPSIPTPARSNRACGFPALGFPARFAPRVMGPARPGALSAVVARTGPGTHRKARAGCRATTYSTSSSRSPAASGCASGAAALSSRPTPGCS